MTVKGFVESNGWSLNFNDSVGKFWNIDIGFVNSEDGREDETEFSISAYDLDELDDLFREFCKENSLDDDAVIYVNVVETAEDEDELS